MRNGFRTVFSDYKRRARTREYPWLLTEEQFKEVVEGACFYCGRSRPHTRFNYKYTGVDRFDNTRGYALDNTVSCCGRCNGMKSSLHGDAFLHAIGQIAARRMGI